MAKNRRDDPIQHGRDLSGMPQGAFAHPEDRRALAKLERLPGIKWAMEQLGKHSYEHVMRLSLLAKSIRVGKRAFPRLDGIMADVCRSLDIPQPDLFVEPLSAARARTTGVDSPVIVVSSGLLGLLSEDEMFCALAHQASHIHCGHLWYLMVCDFVRDAKDTLGIAGAPLMGPQLALEEWRRRAELSCDRGALLASADLASLTRMLMKLAGADGNAYGAVEAESLCEQKEAFLRWTRGLSLGRLYRMGMYLDTASSFTALRVAEIQAWATSPMYQALASGQHEHAELSAREEAKAPPLWGEFAGHPHVCPSCGQTAAGDAPVGVVGRAHQAYDGIRSVVDHATSVAQYGAAAFRQALGTIFEAVTPGRPQDSQAGPERDAAVRIPVRSEE